jgi:fibro-slime domain-containing protein
MNFNKLISKTFALILFGIVSSIAAGIEPLSFGGTTASDVDNWNYLTNYKMWGQTGISFGNNNVFDKADGWVGSAGSLTSTGNDAKIAGAIIVGGKADNTGNMAFTTGPVRTGSGITNAGRVTGTTCSGTNTAGSCADVPLYRTDLTIPKLDKPANNYNNISVVEYGTVTVDLSSGPYDLYIDSFSMGQEATVIIKMPKGQVVRIFTKSFSTDNHPNIVVQYTGESFYRCNSKTSEFKCGGEYEGNLLIYVDGDVTFSNVDYHPIVGTIVSSGTINIICNMSFAGQLMAKTLKVGNEVKGDGFKFVPIKRTPKIVLSQKDATFKEDNKLHEIGIGLSSDDGEEDVTFDYCFEFNNKAVTGQFADAKDVTIDNSYIFPICGTDNDIKVTIKKGDLVSDQKIQIKPFIDGVVEESSIGEKLWLKVTNVKGAEVSQDNYDAAHGFNLYITDSDEYPRVSSELVVNVDEDSKHTFSSSEFNFVHSTRTFASVKIVTTPDKGSLLLNGTAVTQGQTITVDNLTKLTYAPAANDFGNNYTTFKYQVIGSGTGDNTSIEYTATVNVVPVNDKPTTESKYTFTVPEEPGKDLVLGSVTNSDVSNELGKDSYKFTLVSTSTGYADFSAKFELTSDGKVKVKGSQTFSYYTKYTYTVKAIVTDNAATEWSGRSGNKGALSSAEFTIVVNVKNQNHAPTIDNQSFELPEKNKTTSGIVDWTSSKVVGNVTAKDIDGDNLTYKVIDSGIPFAFKSSTSSLVIADGSKLDYETKASWTFKVSATDPSGASATATITVNLTDVNEPSSSTTISSSSIALSSSSNKFSSSSANIKSSSSPAINFQSMKISALLLDWAGESYHDSIDIDFGNVYGGNKYTKVGNDSTCQYGIIKQMVRDTLVNGQLVRVDSLVYPWDKCAAGHEIDKWFVPQVVAKDAAGNKYTNSAHKDIEFSLDNEGFWNVNYTNESGDCNDPVSPGFFPLDDFDYLDSAKTIKNPKFDWNVPGWVNSGSGFHLDTCMHNYSFAMKISTQFKYAKGQSFEIIGDDDFWIFINNKLALDYGGIHDKIEGAINLDTLGLKEGNVYPFHIFYAERNITGSNLKIRTSITFINSSSSSQNDKSSSSTLIKSSSSSQKIASSSSKPKSSSSMDSISSSSLQNDKSSSSKPASSSSTKAKTSSSSSKAVSSSSAKTSNDEIPDFYVRMTGAFEFEIVLDESAPSIAKKYAVMDIKGQVLSVGELNDKNAYVKVPTRGAYIVKVGLGYRRINVR